MHAILDFDNVNKKETKKQNTKDPTEIYLKPPTVDRVKCKKQDIKAKKKIPLMINMNKEKTHILIWRQGEIQLRGRVFQYLAVPSQSRGNRCQRPEPVYCLCN